MSLRRGCLFVLLLMLTACNSPRPATAVATVGTQSISSQELGAYLHYVVGFDALAYPDSAEAACSRRDSGPACRRLHDQALVRLIQEHLVLAYARSHHIALSREDRNQIDAEVAQLSAGAAPTRTLFRNHTVSHSFMRDILSRQLLVQKVQEVIAGQSAERGLAYRVRKLTIHVRRVNKRDAVYRQMLAVAHGGSPPEGTHERVEWVAPFRLSSELDRALRRARPGAYTGPFATATSLTVMQLLARHVHRYGAPARKELAARSFRFWLHQAARHAHLQCSVDHGRLAPCPRRIINSV